MTYIDENFLQFFIGERFRALSIIPVELKTAKPHKIIVDGIKKDKTSHLKPRGLRWYGATWSEEPRKPLSKIINNKKSYNFCLYTYKPRGVTLNLFYSQ